MSLDPSIPRVAEVIALQPLAVVDHVCSVTEPVLKTVISNPEEIGGSRRISQQEVQSILATVGEFHSKAGGSAANTVRGLASGFGVLCDLVGVRGQDEWGAFFESGMKRAKVGTLKLRARPGATGRCVILSCDGQRSMRTCLSDAVRLTAADLEPADLAGARWLVMSGYCLYGEGLIPAALQLAKDTGVKVALDLASFEVVRAFRGVLVEILATGLIDCCFCNEDEGVEIIGGSSNSDSATPEAGLAFLAEQCEVAVVTLGEKGCIVQRRGEDGVIAEPACSGVKLVDATGAGDLFASGFLYGLLRGLPTRRCAQIGCLAGGAVVQSVGAEMTAANWSWMFARMHGELASSVVRDSASAVQQELLGCYALIERLGRGVVYYGSARLKKDSLHWGRASALGGQVASLLGCTTWSGGGPGMMQAATEGALSAGKPVGGIRILREAGNAVLSASYLPDSCQVFCRFLSPRKVALVDAGVRAEAVDRTAYIFLPGGLGTMDELFEIVTLMQLKKLGSKLPVPLILVNYDGFYDGLMHFLTACDMNGTVGSAELKDVIIARTNEEVISSLAQFYKLPDPNGNGISGLMAPLLHASSWIQAAAAAADQQRR